MTGVAVIVGYAGVTAYSVVAAAKIEALTEANKNVPEEVLIDAAEQIAAAGSYVVAVSIALFLIVSIILFKYFIAPIKYVLEYAENLSSGNYKDMPVTKNIGKEFGSLMRYLGYVRDRLQAATLKLSKSYTREEDALREVDAANSKRNDFLASISRGLRDPLNSILGFSGIILKEINKGAYDYRLREKANIIFNSAERLNGLITNLIELSRLDASEVSLKLKEFETSEFMSELIQYNVFEAEQKNISLGTHFTSELPPVLSSDREILFHVLSNLISNAVKASPFGGDVSLGVTCDDDEFVFFVKDSVVEDDTVPLAKVFSKYVESETELFQGVKESSILSLTIVKAHVALLNGRIETVLDSSGSSTFKIIFSADDIVSGDYNDDSTARFYINTGTEGVIESTNQFDTHHVIEVELNLDKPISVLMAENNESNRMLVETVLDETNCELEYVDDGISCLDVLNRRDFDVLLLDHHIHKLEALKVVEALRSNSRFSDLPIIVMAAYMDAEDRTNLLLAGVNDCILKPIDAEELIYLVRSWYKKTH